VESWQGGRHDRKGWRPAARTTSGGEGHWVSLLSDMCHCYCYCCCRWHCTRDTQTYVHKQHQGVASCTLWACFALSLSPLPSPPLCLSLSHTVSLLLCMNLCRYVGEVTRVDPILLPWPGFLACMRMQGIMPCICIICHSWLNSLATLTLLALDFRWIRMPPYSS
jgi:hypothetical protein